MTCYSEKNTAIFRLNVKNCTAQKRQLFLLVAFLDITTRGQNNTGKIQLELLNGPSNSALN